MPTAANGVVGYLGLRMGLSALGAVALLLIGGDVVSGFATLPLQGWLIAAAAGVTLTIALLCGLMALKGASVAQGSLFSAAGLLVPTIADIFLFDQRADVGQ